MTFFILSIDGGGIRGIIPAMVLVELKRRLSHSPLHDYFDMIAGSSTGGIIAAALAGPRAHDFRQPAAGPEELVKFYEQDGAKIFNHNVFAHFTSAVRRPSFWIQEKYDAGALEGVLKTTFGEAKVSDALTTLVLTAYDIEARKVVVITNMKSTRHSVKQDDYLLWQAVRATTAAPTYFEPAVVNNLTRNRLESLIDGGMFSTDPSLVAFTEAKKFLKNNGRSDEKIIMLSVGTGNQNWPYRHHEVKGWSPLQWTRPLISILMQGSASCTSYVMKQLLDDGDNYYRIDGNLWVGCKNHMDDASDQNIRNLKRLAGEFIDQHEEKLGKIAEMLEQEKGPDVTRGTGEEAVLTVVR